MNSVTSLVDCNTVLSLDVSWLARVTTMGKARAARAESIRRVPTHRASVAAGKSSAKPKPAPVMQF